LVRNGVREDEKNEEYQGDEGDDGGFHPPHPHCPFPKNRLMQLKQKTIELTQLDHYVY